MFSFLKYSLFELHKIRELNRICTRPDIIFQKMFTVFALFIGNIFVLFCSRTKRRVYDNIFVRSKQKLNFPTVKIFLFAFWMNEFGL